jgi:hypothetical protein
MMAIPGVRTRVETRQERVVMWISFIMLGERFVSLVMLII